MILKRIKRFLNRVKKTQRMRRDKRKLVLIRKLIIEVVGNELPGNIILHNGREVVIQDVTVSLRKNNLNVQRTLLGNTFTKRQRAAINWQIKQGLKRTDEAI